MTGEPTHTASEMAPRAPAISIIKYPLHLVVSYVQPVAQQYESRTFPEASLQSTLPKEMVPCPNFINYHLKSEVSIMLCCQLYSTRYTAIRIKNCLKAPLQSK